MLAYIIIFCLYLKKKFILGNSPELGYDRGNHQPVVIDHPIMQSIMLIVF